MGNTLTAKLPALSNKIYEEWFPKTVLVQSCDNAYDGELNLQTRELDIPVYHDLSVHQTSIKEREIKPAPIEFVKSSTKRVVIDKGRYSHWGETNLGKIIERLSAENSEVREKLVKKWALEAEKELGIWCAKLPAEQTIDMTAILVADGKADGIVDSTSVLKVLDILKAKAISLNMTPEDFKLFVSEKIETVLRDTKIAFASLDANETFRTGSVGVVNKVDIRKMEIAELTTRNATTSLVDAEWGIWKTRDGIQYVVPYRNTIDYVITPDQVLLGGKGYQTVEYYDFFNLYPTRLYKVALRYKAATNPPVL